ncbi:MAG: hypothetical protein AABX13_05225 [Nanoarchaeota archaeon]
MDEQYNPTDKDNYLEAIARAKRLGQRARALIDIDIETAANRIYLGFENLAQGLLVWKHSRVSIKHAQIWEGMSKLYLQGILSFDPKPYLEQAYQFHLYVDYGKKRFKSETIDFSEEKVQELLSILEKLLAEVEKIVGKGGEFWW